MADEYTFPELQGWSLSLLAHDIDRFQHLLQLFSGECYCLLTSLTLTLTLTLTLKLTQVNNLHPLTMTLPYTPLSVPIPR